MVERILKEAAAMIEEEGIDKLTTNAVAERASVSVGSLYQYFSDREELIRALADEYFEDLRVLFASIFAPSNAAAPLGELLDLMLGRGLALNTGNPGLKRFILSAEAPPALREALDASNRAVMGILVAFMEKRSGGALAGRDAELVFTVSMSMFKALVAALDGVPPEGMDRAGAGARARLIAEYRGIILGYWQSKLGGG